MHRVKVKNFMNLRQVVATSSHEFIAENAGNEEERGNFGSSPWELLLSALAT